MSDPLRFGDPLRFEDPTLEYVYQASRDASLADKTKGGAGRLLVDSLALFLVTQLGSSATEIALVILVLLFHEAGHYLAMRVFRFRDLRMFFIPFFGAEVSGRSAAAAAWKEGIVLLLGPLPGLLSDRGLVTEVQLRRDGRELRAHIVVDDHRIYRLSALAPLLDGREHQLFEHFRLLR